MGVGDGFAAACVDVVVGVDVVVVVGGVDLVVGRGVDVVVVVVAGGVDEPPLPHAVTNVTEAIAKSSFRITLNC